MDRRERYGYDEPPQVHEIDLPSDWREQKFKSDMEQLCKQFLDVGGDAQVGAALLFKTASDVIAIAVLREVQDEFKSVLAWLVSQVRELKMKGDGDVSADGADQGAVPGQREQEDGEDGAGAQHHRAAGEGG